MKVVHWENFWPCISKFPLPRHYLTLEIKWRKLVCAVVSLLVLPFLPVNMLSFFSFLSYRADLRDQFCHEILCIMIFPNRYRVQQFPSIALPVLHDVKVWLNGWCWLVTSSFVLVATTHKCGALRKLLTTYQQVSTTRPLSSVGNWAEVTWWFVPWLQSRGWKVTYDNLKLLTW